MASNDSSIITRIVTVKPKTTQHQYSGTGSGLGYYLDDIESPLLTLISGKTYRFKQDDSSNASHQLRFYATADRATPYTANVTTVGTAGSSGAYTEILVTDATPVNLHYQCVNHAYMGNGTQLDSTVVATPDSTPAYSITPSTRQVNEGDSLSTTLSGFTPNSTLFFRVTGRGINKKDFSAGAVKGRVRVDGSGVATISHTLRADKATEGEESFSVQIFSDKRMRNSLGQSDAVTVFDTSVKAPKVGKPPKGGVVDEPTNPIGTGINPMTSITPSTLQVNEGDSLNTTLSGFTPNSTLFFSVTGRGINKKDFSAGAVKGRVRVDGSGVATISHTLRADKATEGEESFSVQIFSDKRMRNSLGQSDAVTVFDTSVKAPKVGKPPKGGGGVKEPTNPIGKETGRFIEFDDGIKFFSGQTYTHDSVTGQKLLKYGQNALATYCPKLSCTDDDDIRLANQEIDPVTGYRSLDALPPGATYQWNLQFNETYLALTGQYTNGSIKTTSRVVYKGENKFEGNKLVRYQPQLEADIYVNGHSPQKAYSGGVKEVSGKNFSAPFTFRGSDKGGIGTSRQISTYNSDTKFASTSQMTAHLNFENGKFFYNGWDANISANLL